MLRRGWVLAGLGVHCSAASSPHSRQQHGHSETEEYSSDSESESEDEEELQLILEDLQRQNEELEVSGGQPPEGLGTTNHLFSHWKLTVERNSRTLVF